MRQIEQDVVNSIRVDLPQNPQMRLGIAATTKSIDNHSLSVGQTANDTPGMQPIVVGRHGKVGRSVCTVALGLAGEI